MTGWVGEEGSGANCAHDSITAAGRQGASRQARLSISLYYLSFIQEKPGASKRDFFTFSWSLLTKQSCWYLQTKRELSKNEDEVEWAKKKKKTGKHHIISAFYMHEVKCIHLLYLVTYLNIQSESWSEAASATAAAHAIMCFYLWDTWSHLAGEEYSKDVLLCLHVFVRYCSLLLLRCSLFIYLIVLENLFSICSLATVINCSCFGIFHCCFR